MLSSMLMLTEAEYRYLKTIYILGGSKGFVKTSKLARRLSVKTPTAIRIVQSLAVKGFVKVVPRVGVILTEDGVKEAIEIAHKHGVLEVFLHEVLELNPSDAHEEALKLETRISHKVCDRLCSLLNKPSRAPCGLEIVHRHP
ncbi:hypothetical protein DRO58_09055 [Candidatus Bathyarchaeota archaeon]|nr:MAG: hypothetical protein DRO58_09055 [Candidatus Bathyarchaeota archaeon]